MEAMLSPAVMTRQIEALAAGKFLRDPVELLRDTIGLLRPPKRMSTVECAEQYRLLPGNEDGAVLRYDRWRTPYNVGPMNSLDDPKCRLLVLVKPSRSGGTTIAENYLFKMMMFGPMGHVSWVLNSDEAVTDYCRNVFSQMFALNADLQAKVGPARGDDTDSFKRVRGYPVEVLSAKDSTFRNRQPFFMVSDETDAWAKRFAATPKVQIDARQKTLGNRRKGAIMSHPDLGWSSGVAACFEDSTRGVFIMKCPECDGHAAAFATKFWPELPQFKLDWTRSDSASNDERLDLAERSAGMTCPHCGVALTDDQRREMIDEAVRGGKEWLHRGQTLDVLEGVMGEMIDHPVHGYWQHGLMLKTASLGQLARDYEAALIRYETTRNADVLKEFMSKALGEVFEGAATIAGLTPEGIRQRGEITDERPGYDRGTVPPGVLFITAGVDTADRRFDVSFIGWDLQGRSWLLDRLAIRQRMHPDGIARDLHLRDVADDWTVLIDDVVKRSFPLARDPDRLLPVACVCVDSGGSGRKKGGDDEAKVGITWKARTFARKAFKAGHYWTGANGSRFSKIKLIKGLGGKQPMIPDAPRKVDKDEMGRPVEPVLAEYNLGVNALKDLIYERLAVTGDAPGECMFYRGFERRYAEEFFGEKKIDGEWVRTGANETLDTYGYAEAARQILQPDNADRNWSEESRRPVWARPISSQPEGGDPEDSAQGETTKPTTRTISERFGALNQGN